MWIINLFTKTKSIDDNESINEESINISSKHEEEPIIIDLKKRVAKVNMIHAKLRALQNKQDLNLNNNTTNMVRDKDKECASTNGNKKNVETKYDYKIEDVLMIIPVIENNLLSLNKKVSCLSGLLDAKEQNAKIVTEQNIVSINTSINSSSNSVNKLNKTISTKKDTSPGIVSEENKKMRKNKQSFIIKKKYSYRNVNKMRTNFTEIINKDDQEDKVTNNENVPKKCNLYSVKSIDQSTNLDVQLDFFFTKLQSALTQYKIDQVKENSEIVLNLSRLENKINMNYTKMDKLMSNVEQLSKINDPVLQNIVMKSQSNIEIENKHELQKSLDDIKICIDYLIRPNHIDILPIQQSKSTDTPNINGTCNSNRCVCQLIDNTNASSTQIINSYDGNNQKKYGDFILCEFLRAQLTLKRIRRDEHQQIAQIDQCLNQIDTKKNSYLSVSLNKSNCVKNNGIEKQNEVKKVNHLTLYPKQSNHHFLKTGVDNYIKSNQPITKKSVCEKNKICFDFLSSQPIPEWMKRGKNLVASDNYLCCRDDAKFSPTNCNLNVDKFYNIERIMKDSDEKYDIVYEITQKPNVLIIK